MHDIEQAIARYGAALDARDFAALAALHGVDAEWSFAIGGHVVVGPIHGRDAIVAFASTPPDSPPVQQRHVLTNVVIDAATHEAGQATAYLTLIAALDVGPTIVATGTAAFTLSATDDTWRIEKLLIVFDNPPLPH